MSTVSIEGTMIKNGKKYNFNIEDSYAFRNDAAALAALIEPTKFLEIFKNNHYFRDDGFISFMTIDVIEDILFKNAMDRIYQDLMRNKMTKGEFSAAGKTTRIIINYDKETFSTDGDKFSFIEIKRDIVEGIFYD